ncbi:MAG: DUF393 domain-containing protein [candidate division KSB1 bacterium]|nr:DUF393 domain-containing protein [candidate division KSB1 bacterium]
MSPAVLIYDGECGLCREAKAWIEKHDPEHKIELLPCQSPERSRRFPFIAEKACLEAVCLVDGDNRVFFGIEAMEQIVRLLIDRRAAAILALPVVRFFSRRVYSWIARHRLKLSCLITESPK